MLQPLRAVSGLTSACRHKYHNCSDRVEFQYILENVFTIESEEHVSSEIEISQLLFLLLFITENNDWSTSFIGHIDQTAWTVDGQNATFQGNLDFRRGKAP